MENAMVGQDLMVDPDAILCSKISFNLFSALMPEVFFVTRA